MKQPEATFFIEKISFVKRTGYALIASSLILLLFLASASHLRSPSAALYSYGLFAAGIVLVLLSKVLEIIQYHRLKKLSAYCSACGWYGGGSDWYRSECCPECDSEEVLLG